MPARPLEPHRDAGPQNCLMLAGRLTGLYVRVVKGGTDLRAALTKVLADRAAAETA